MFTVDFTIFESASSATVAVLRITFSLSFLDCSVIAVSIFSIVTESATPVSVEINKSEEATIADDSVLEPNEDEVEAEDINVSEEGEQAPEAPENTPEEALEEPSEDEVVETEAAEEDVRNLNSKFSDYVA